jgi:ERCC4-type nuclease
MKIIIDSREKKPLTFGEIPTIVQKLKTGDYSVCGLEDKLCIERKASVAEVALNVVQERFVRELKRMHKMEHSYLLLEFSIQDVLIFPAGSAIPKSKRKFVRARGPFIMSKLKAFEKEYDIEMIFAENRANCREIAIGIMKDFYQKYKL